MVTQKLWLGVGIWLLALMVRYWGLGEIMTVDEERWILRSSDFYERLFDYGDTGGTFQTTHPGATGMWLMGAGVRYQEGRLGYQADESNIADFQKVAKAPVAVVTSLLVAFITVSLVGLFGTPGAVGAGLFLALDPYLTGMSQIAHLDALLALFMLLSAVMFLRGLVSQTRKSDGVIKPWPRFELVASGVAAGLALGLKGLPVIWLGVWWGLVLVVQVMWEQRSGWWLNIQWAVRVWFFTAGVAVLTFYLVWPALWTTSDLGRSIVRDYGQVVTDAHVEIEFSEDPIEPASFYIRSLLGRLTPFVQGLLLVTSFFLFRSWRRKHDMSWWAVVWLLAYAVGYVVMITLAAKKGDRYALPALAGFIVVAGMMGVVIGRWLWQRVTRWQQSGWKVMAVVVTVMLLVQSWLWSPHAIGYSNPLFPDVRPRTQQGWGEGLEMAAAWLNERPFIDRLSIASWYPSVTSVFFTGRTFSLSSREDHRVGYVVLYRNMEDRAEDDIASNVLDEFAGQEPEKVFSIRGVPYVWIYNVLGPYYFRLHVQEITRDVEVGQLVPVERDDLRRVDLAFATFSGRNNIEDVIVEIKDSPDSEEVLRRMVTNAAEIPDEAWQSFEFDPIPDSAGKTYYVSVRSPDSVPGNAITVRFAPEDVMPGQAVVRREPLRAGQKQSDFVRAGDLGYRVFFQDKLD